MHYSEQLTSQLKPVIIEGKYTRLAFTEEEIAMDALKRLGETKSDYSMFADYWDTSMVVGSIAGLARVDFN